MQVVPKSAKKTSPRKSAAKSAKKKTTPTPAAAKPAPPAFSKKPIDSLSGRMNGYATSCTNKRFP